MAPSLAIRSMFGFLSAAFQQGPIFGNLILADEINRTPAKAQAALLEAMEERQVTVAGKTHPLPDLFLVLATQNPIEQEGTYPPAGAATTTAQKADDWPVFFSALASALAVSGGAILAWKNRAFWQRTLIPFRPLHLSPLNPDSNPKI